MTPTGAPIVEKVSDVVGLYLNPPEAAVVMCVDEKSQGAGRPCPGHNRPSQ